MYWSWALTFFLYACEHVTYATDCTYCRAFWVFLHLPVYRCQLGFLCGSEGFVGTLVTKPAAEMLFNISCYWQRSRAGEDCQRRELELFSICTAGEPLLFVDCDSSWHQTAICLAAGTMQRASASHSHPVFISSKMRLCFCENVSGRDCPAF